MNIFTQLARQSIEYYLKENRIMATPANLPDELTKNQAGAFVSLHNKTDNELRGCIGTFLPTKKNLAEEIIHNAISAATEDPRFPPVTINELKDIEISVDILSKPELVTLDTKLDPKIHGLIVSTLDGRKGLLLPDIEGVETKEEQERICCLKGSIQENEDTIKHYFTVNRYKE